MSGLNIINENGVLTIDNNHRNLSLLAKVRLGDVNQTIEKRLHAVDGIWLVMHYYKHSFPITIPANKYALLVVETLSNNYVNANIFIKQNSVDIEVKSTGLQNDAFIYLFTDVLRSNNERFGLELYDENGNIVFDSENQYLRISDGKDNGKNYGLVFSHAETVFRSMSASASPNPDIGQAMFSQYLYNLTNGTLSKKHLAIVVPSPPADHTNPQADQHLNAIPNPMIADITFC